MQNIFFACFFERYFLLFFLRRRPDAIKKQENPAGPDICQKLTREEGKPDSEALQDAQYLLYPPRIRGLEKMSTDPKRRLFVERA
jgi:hypothetical protein